MNIQDAQMMFKQVVQENAPKHAKEQLKFILQQKKAQLKFEQSVDKEFKHVLKEIGRAIYAERRICTLSTCKATLRGREAQEADKVFPMMRKVAAKLRELGYTVELHRNIYAFLFEINMDVSGWASEVETNVH